MNDKNSQVSKECLIQAVDLHKTYGTRGDPLEVLKGASFEVQPGEIVGVVGASGVGKSTLLHMLGGLDRPNAGKVFFRGQDIFAQKNGFLETFRNRHVGFVFQSFNLLADFTALENVMFPALIGKVDKKLAREKAENLLAQVGLQDRLEHRPAELSGGETQRVALARGLVNDPELLLADEPTGNLDYRASDSLIDLLIQLNQKTGQTFVVVTHSQRVAAKMHKVYQMLDGKVTRTKKEFII